MKELENKFQEIDNQLSDLYSNQSLIYDGILDFEEYFSGKAKIAWILKEPYDDFDENGNPIGGGWHFREALLPKKAISEFSKGSRNTYEPMIYSTFSTLNGFPNSKEMDYISDRPEMLNSLKNIAYINVKKTAGQTQTPDSVLYQAYQNHKELLLKQIELCNPDILIFGNTYKYFENDLSIKQTDFIKNDSLEYVIKDNRLYIRAYHPAQRKASTGYSKWDYIDDIVNTSKLFFERIKK
jgi:hypothetical protein